MKLENLKGVIPDTVLQQIPEVMNKYNINTTLRLSHFLSQCAHESGNFKVFVENLNYSNEGLLKIFPKYFNQVTATQYARKPEAIGSRVYASRMGNGIEATKDGYKFRGRGAIQLTGKISYENFGKAINEDLLNNPDLVATKYALLSAAWFWNKNNLNVVADMGMNSNIVTAVTKIVNGGSNGLNNRIEHFNKFYKLLA